MDITVFEFIDYAEKDIFTIKKVINSWENIDDVLILKEIGLPERKNKYILF